MQQPRRCKERCISIRAAAARLADLQYRETENKRKRTNGKRNHRRTCLDYRHVRPHCAIVQKAFDSSARRLSRDRRLALAGPRTHLRSRKKERPPRSRLARWPRQRLRAPWPRGQMDLQDANARCQHRRSGPAGELPPGKTPVQFRSGPTLKQRPNYLAVNLCLKTHRTRVHCSRISVGSNPNRATIFELNVESYRRRSAVQTQRRRGRIASRATPANTKVKLPGSASSKNEQERRTTRDTSPLRNPAAAS